MEGSTSDRMPIDKWLVVLFEIKKNTIKTNLSKYQ